MSHRYFYKASIMLFNYSHEMFKLVQVGIRRHQLFSCLRLASTNSSFEHKNSSKFETVFSLPSIKFFAIFNRLKVYHLSGCGIALPCAGLLENLSVIPEHSFLAASYIGITGACLLSLASLPFRNIVGFLYVSEDNKSIKISTVDFWGKRKDQIVLVDDWVPLMNLSPKFTDFLYLSAQLNNGTVFKLFLRFGKVANEQKMTSVLE